MTEIAIFDVDGTLVDTNYHHAIAWHRAFLAHDVVLPMWHIHRAIGMGGDLLVAHVAGKEVEERHGHDIRARWEKEFDKMLGDVQPFASAHELLRDVRRRGFKVVLASSGKKKHVDVFLDLVDAKSVADDWTTSEDAERSKPAPDLVAVAMKRVAGGSAVLVGDSPWDCRAAAKLGVSTIAVRTGGFSPEELEDAGAAQVFDSLGELRDGLNTTALAHSTGSDR